MSCLWTAPENYLPLEYVAVSAHSGDSELIEKTLIEGVRVNQGFTLFSRVLRNGLKVVKCYPFSFGLTSKRTRIQLIPCERPVSLCSAGAGEVCALVRLLSRVLALVVPALRADVAWLPLLFCAALLVRNWRRTLPLTCQPASEHVMTTLAPSLSRLDYHSVALVNWQTLVYSGVRSHAWLMYTAHSGAACPSGSGCDGTPRSEGLGHVSRQGPACLCGHRWLRLVRCDRVSCGHALVSATMWHALQSNCNNTHRTRTLRVWGSDGGGEKGGGAPHVAASVAVAQLVASPEDRLTLEQCQSLLTAYFDRDRLLITGDVLSVPVSGDLARPVRHGGVAFFRVQSASGASFSSHSIEHATSATCSRLRNGAGEGLLFLAGVTSLYQVSDAVAALPSLQPLTATAWEPGLIPALLSPQLQQLVCSLQSLSASPAPLSACPPLIAVCGAARCLQHALLTAAAASCGCALSWLDCHRLVGEAGSSGAGGAAAVRIRQQLTRFLTPHSAAATVTQVVVLSDAGCLARQFIEGDSVAGAEEDWFSAGSSRVNWRQLSALQQLVRQLCGAGVCVVLTASHSRQLLPQLRQHVTHTVNVSVDDPWPLLLWHAACDRLFLTVQQPGRLARLLRRVQADQLPALLQRAKLSCVERAHKWFRSLNLPLPLDVPQLSLDLDDITRGLEMLRSRTAVKVGVPRVVETRWPDIGGVDQVRRQILDTMQLQLAAPHLFSDGLTRSGLLLYGPPGTGKTMVARAVATECNLHFLSVKGPELINMYVGQSEANIRDVFKKAREASPCVIFFDEIDSLAPKRGNKSDSAGVMDRVTAQLLTELDSAAASVHVPAAAGDGAVSAVFVMAATNRPDLLDPALLRPGRFDKLICLPAARGRAQQLQILRAQTRRLELCSDVDLSAVVEMLPGEVTGADVCSVCEHAVRLALDAAVSAVECEGASELHVPLAISHSQLARAARSLTPSLSADELQHYQQLRRSMHTG